MTLEKITSALGYVSAIVTAAILLITPLRNKVLGYCNIFNGLECLLRSEVLRMYYKHQDDRQLRQYERENLEAEYKAYKALGGNSFVDDIHDEITGWKVIT